ncbi:MAG: phytanoyl-CoA dioxygenase family protein [Gemmatimonadetes bacterium]|nr:phytanoyl-CoA dioxygenase family protein [Gemmatimonadota bacterium]
MLTMNTRVPLSREDVNNYHEEGFLIPDLALPNDVLAKIQNSYSEIGKVDNIVDHDHVLAPHVGNHAGNGVPPHLARDWLEYAHYPLILDVLEQLIGPDILLWSSVLFGKPAHTGKRVPWHQDAPYWPIRPMAACTVWIAIDDSTRENGCLEVVSGSHKAQREQEHSAAVSDEDLLDRAIDEKDINEDDIRFLELKAGQFSVHDAFLVHGSDPNRTDHRRAGLTLRFMPGTSVYDRSIAGKLAEDETEAFETRARPVFLCRGADRTERNTNIICI